MQNATTQLRSDRFAASLAAVASLLLLALGRLPQLLSPHLFADGDEAIVGLPLFAVALAVGAGLLALELCLLLELHAFDTSTPALRWGFETSP
jgi:hypothetical protein